MKVFKKQVKTQVYKNTEDSLTYNVISRLSYLPKTLFGEILNNSFGIDPEIDFGTIKELHYWPTWNSSNSKQKRVIPDVFMRLENFDVIIEAKRWEYGQQNTSQWKNEIDFYRSNYPEGKKLLFIALGGMTYQNQNFHSVKIIQAFWSHINEECYKLRFKTNNEIDKRILGDINEIFKWYNLPRPVSLDTLPRAPKINNDTIKNLLEWTIS